MLKTRVIPCLLLKGAGLVKTIRFRDPKYIGDPINTVKIFNEKEVDEIVILDITATAEGRRPPMELLSQIVSEAFMPVGYGGGIRTLEDAQEILSLGVEKIAVNTIAEEEPEFVRRAADRFGSQSVVVSIDVASDQVVTRAAKRKTGRDPVEFARLMERMGAGELLLNSVDRDGTMQGYDVDLIRRVAGAVGIPVIACGGAGKLSDFGDAVRAGASAVAAGSLFVFQGKHRAVLISYPGMEELRRVLG